MAERGIVQELEKAREEREWFNENYDELFDKYEGHALAIKDKKIIATDRSFIKLLEKLKDLGEDPATLYIDTIPSRDISFIL